MLPGQIFPGLLGQRSFRHVVVLDSSLFLELMGHQIMTLRMGKAGALFIWVRTKHLLGRSCMSPLQTFVCLTAFFVCQTALQACSRTVYAFSRDKGILLAVPNATCTEERNPFRLPGQGLLWLCLQTDAHSSTCHLAHDLFLRTPRLA